MALRQISGCWIDIFELSRYRGCRRRLFGPAHYVSFRSGSAHWGVSVDSAIVGPDAHVRFYDSSRPTTTAIWVLPRQKVINVADFKIGDEIDSIQIGERPPIDGEPGYDVFVAIVERKKG